ncbi:MAG: hypothetical protein KA004_08340 [Verrucomicrobiales bacterium]|nr:hypothetical protein [Verrucomicrobiales bacterium]
MADSLQRALVSVRASGKMGSPLAVFARTHKTCVGKGWSFDIQEPALTGAEQLLGILAADVLGLFLEIAARRRLQVDETEATLRAELVGALSHLGVVGAAGVPHYDCFVIKAFVGSPASRADLQAAWEEAQRRAPLLHTLRRAARVELSLQFT